MTPFCFFTLQTPSEKGPTLKGKNWLPLGTFLSPEQLKISLNAHASVTKMAVIPIDIKNHLHLQICNSCFTQVSKSLLAGLLLKFDSHFSKHVVLEIKPRIFFIFNYIFILLIWPIISVHIPVHFEDVSSITALQ